MASRLFLALWLIALPVAAQEAPRPLFPTAPAPGPVPAANPDAPIAVEDLPAPAVRQPGLAAAEVELAGPLWNNGAPPDLADLLRRLPAAIAAPTLQELQRALLAAPGPAGEGADALLAVRAERLLAMGEAATALELLDSVQDAPGPAGDPLHLAAAFAAGRTDTTCAAAPAAPEARPWVEAAIVCAALAGDTAAVEAGLARIEATGAPDDANLAGLARAAVAGGRHRLVEPVADDPLQVPLLRRVPLDVDPAVAVDLPPAVRRALADNPGLSSATRAAVVPAARTAPSIRPELNGGVPADWNDAAASVPAAERARWAALVDGLALPLPDPVWAEIAAAAPPDPGPPPDLATWRGFEVASLREQRGGVLLYTLLLLDGRPAAAAPVTLRRALDALIALGLERDARALAADTGGALGL
jgi:hypothetical protein